MAKYRNDKDLAFLQYMSNEQLGVLVRYLTIDKDGKQRYSEGLTSNSEFKQANGNYKKVWPLIAAEIQLYGGDSVVNLFRGTGILYREILIDVCKKMNLEDIDFDRDDTEFIEHKMLMHLFLKVWDEMSEEDRNEIKRNLNIDISSSAADILHLIADGGIISYQIGIIIATIVARIMGTAIPTFFAGRIAAFALGPIGIAVATLMTVPLISGAAYRVTMPVVIQVAVMRQEYEQLKKQV